MMTNPTSRLTSSSALFLQVARCMVNEYCYCYLCSSDHPERHWETLSLDKAENDGLLAMQNGCEPI